MNNDFSSYATKNIQIVVAPKNVCAAISIISNEIANYLPEKNSGTIMV